MSKAGTDGRRGLPSSRGQITQGPATELGLSLGDLGLGITQDRLGSPFGSHSEIISFLIAPKTY